MVSGTDDYYSYGTRRRKRTAKTPLTPWWVGVLSYHLSFLFLLELLMQFPQGRSAMMMVWIAGGGQDRTAAVARTGPGGGPGIGYAYGRVGHVRIQTGQCRTTMLRDGQTAARGATRGKR